MAYTAAALMEPSYDVDKLSYEIFSILESRFLFGYDDIPAPQKMVPPTAAADKVRILSIDAGGGGLLPAVALVRLESSLRHLSGQPSARISDFFDVAAGSGTGGILAAMLFTRGPDGRPLFSADEALRHLSHRPKKGLLRSIFRRRKRGEEIALGLGRVFSDATLKDTVKPVLVACHDLATGAPFLFSRADAVEADAFNFRLRDVCAATCAAVEVRSVDGRTRVVAAAGAAGGNPTAAAITHVLNNKREFPLADGVDDLLVLSLGGGEEARPSAAAIAGLGMGETVDEAVAMAFGEKKRMTNYVRIQTNGMCDGVVTAEAALTEHGVESVLFRGKKVCEKSNGERLEWLAAEVVKEQERRVRWW